MHPVISKETEQSTWGERLPPSVRARMQLPVIAAPMLRASGPELVTAICAAGAMAAFPTVNARTPEMLDEWLTSMERAEAEAERAAPYCANLVMRPDLIDTHLPVLVEHRLEFVITSVGSPAPVVDALHEVGSFVLSDVATLEHAQKAVRAGADGLVLLTAGCGGQTGWMNPFAFVRAVREFFDGIVVLAGGMSDGVALSAALALGADLGYVGTKFIAASESLATDRYRQRLVDCSLDDILMTRAFTGLSTSFLRPAIIDAGLDPSRLDEEVTPEIAEAVYGGRGTAEGPKRWTDIVSAGHSVSGVHAIEPGAGIVERLAQEFNDAQPRNVIEAVACSF
jgi:nitronate monooxygenase